MFVNLSGKFNSNDFSGVKMDFCCHKISEQLASFPCLWRRQNSVSRLSSYSGGVGSVNRSALQIAKLNKPQEMETPLNSERKVTFVKFMESAWFGTYRNLFFQLSEKKPRRDSQTQELWFRKSMLYRSNLKNTQEEKAKFQTTFLYLLT